MTMTTATLTTQTAVYSALHGDATLHALAETYDFVPENSDYPYVKLNVSESVSNTFDRDGRLVTITLDIWSQAEGFSEAYMLLGHCIRLLEKQQLALSSGTMVYCFYLGNPVPVEDPDGLSRHLVARFESLIEE